MRRPFEHAGTEHEHEPALPRIVPVDLADAGDARLDDAPEHVEAHADRRAAGRHERAARPRSTPPPRQTGRRRGQNAPSTMRSLAGERIAPGDDELAGDRPVLAHGVDRCEVERAPLDADDARAQHRDEARRRRRCRRGRAGYGDAVALILLDVDQEHVGRIGPEVEGELALQVHLEQPHAEMKKLPSPTASRMTRV